MLHILSHMLPLLGFSHIRTTKLCIYLWCFLWIVLSWHEIGFTTCGIGRFHRSDCRDIPRYALNRDKSEGQEHLCECLAQLPGLFIFTASTPLHFPFVQKTFPQHNYSLWVRSSGAFFHYSLIYMVENELLLYLLSNKQMSGLFSVCNQEGGRQICRAILNNWIYIFL